LFYTKVNYVRLYSGTMPFMILFAA